MLCSQCGNDNPVSNRFCGNCGAKLDAPAAAELVSESRSRPVAPPLDLRDPTDPGRIVIPANGRNTLHDVAADDVASHDVASNDVTDEDVADEYITPARNQYDSAPAPDPDEHTIRIAYQPAAHEVGPSLDAPVAYSGHEQVQAEPIEPAHYMAASGEVTSREVPPARRDTSVHGPSLLGLNDDYVTESTDTRDTTDYSYLYDEEGGGGRTVNWRLMLGLLLVIGFGGVLAYMWTQGKNWNTAIIHGITGNSRDQKATETKPGTGGQNSGTTGQSNDTVAKVGPTTPGGPEIAVGATPSNIPASTTPQSDQAGDTSKNSPANNNSTKNASAPSNPATTPTNPLDSTSAGSATPADAKNAKSANTKPGDAKPADTNGSTQAKAPEPANAGEDAGDEEAADTPAPPAKRGAAAAPATARSAAKSKRGSPRQSANAGDDTADDTALVHRADALLRARSCNQAVDLLREAALHGNATARSRLGGLYATGHCVPLDRAEAYNWFTLAKDAGARYSWIEHNRSMLWAQMSERERERVMRR